MADETKDADHRYFQKHGHVKVAREEETKTELMDSAITRIDAALARPRTNL